MQKWQEYVSITTRLVLKMAPPFWRMLTELLAVPYVKVNKSPLK